MDSLLYENVLKREPDEEGLSYWLKVMQEGSLRHEVLVGFSESGEHVEQIEAEYAEELAEAESIEYSLEDTREHESNSDEGNDASENKENDSADDAPGALNDSSDDDINDDVDSDQEGLSNLQELTLLYNALFNRDPDQQGLGYWMGELASQRVNPDDIITLLMASDEFTELHGENLSDSDFIDALYNNSVGRASDDAQGKGFWISQLASGKARTEILESLYQSDEHIEIVLSGDTSTTAPLDGVLV